MTLDKDFYMNGRENEKINIKNAFAFNNTIDYFPPESELFYLLGHGGILLEKKVNKQKTPQEFTITANYKFHDNIYSERTNINLKQYEGIVIYSDSVAENLKELKEITRQLGEIKKKLNNKK